MVRRRYSVTVLLLVWWLTVGLCDCTVYFFAWSYPPNKPVNPADVTITISQGTILDSGLTMSGGSVFFRTPNDVECYTVTIAAPGFRYQKSVFAECPRTFLPEVIRGQ